MPKRVVDGEGLWRSDKLATVTPPKYRAEYANLLPLALANGVFEANPSRVWSEVYSYNRPDVSRETVVTILEKFENVGLLFRWTDPSGKAWGYWTGSEKPGRLPSQSTRTRYGVGPTPPAEQLAQYAQRNGHSQADAPIVETPIPSKRKPLKTMLPETFGISDAVRKWANANGYTHLEEHLEHFIGLAKAKGYTYASWDSAFQNAIRQNWAKLDAPVRPVGESLLARHNTAMENA